MLDIHFGANHGPAGERPFGDVEVDAIFLPKTVEPVITPVADVRMPLLDQRAAGIPLDPHHGRLIKAIPAGAIQKPHLRIEVPPDLDDPRQIVPRASLVREPRAVSGRISVATGCG